jgi:hypothetical protein
MPEDRFFGVGADRNRINSPGITALRHANRPDLIDGTAAYIRALAHRSRDSSGDHEQAGGVD